MAALLGNLNALNQKGQKLQATVNKTKRNPLSILHSTKGGVFRMDEDYSLRFFCKTPFVSANHFQPHAKKYSSI